MLDKAIGRDETAFFMNPNSKSMLKGAYCFAGLLALVSGLIAILVVMMGIQSNNMRIVIADEVVLEGIGSASYLAFAGVMAALTLGLTTHLLASIPRSAPAVISNTSRLYTRIPFFTTLALLIADGIALIMFLESNEKSEARNTVVIGPYLFLFLLSLIALGFLLFRLDHLTAISVAVLSNGMGVILVGYEAYRFDHPFQAIGLALSTWALVIILLNSIPAVTRASRRSFILSATPKDKLAELGLILVIAIGVFPAFQFTIFQLEEMSFSNDIYPSVLLGFILLPLIAAFLIFLTRKFIGPYPEAAVNEKTWLKAIAMTLSLSGFAFCMVLYGLWTHNAMF